MTDQQKALEILESLYPQAKTELMFHNPYEALICTMLAAQCTDRQVNKISPALFAAYPDAAAMAQATYDEVYPYVKSCGFKSKAERIIETSKMLVANHGGQVPADLDALQKLPGVGRKTANVVLAFAFGQDTMPVDTHVFRVSNRIGLANANNVRETERQLCALIPKEKWSQAHHWILLHGRRVCDAKKPRCEACPVNQFCKEYKKRGQ